MIKKLITCMLTGGMLLSTCGVLFLSSCKEDEAPSPGKPEFSVTPSSGTGILNETEYTFTINEISADAVTLYPYGLAEAAKGTEAVTFDGGPATITFKYQHSGTFAAVVVANNHTSNGSDVKNNVSDPISISIVNDKASMVPGDFSLAYKEGDDDDDATINADSVVYDEGTQTFEVYMPYAGFGVVDGQDVGMFVDITQLIATFNAAAYSTVTVGSVTQESGTTVNDFTSEVDYVVTSEDGNATNTYHVNVTIQAPNSDVGVTAISAKAYYYNEDDDLSSLEIVGSVNGGDLVLYETYDLATYSTLSQQDSLRAALSDSVAVSYELSSSYSIMRYDSTGGPYLFEQGKVLGTNAGHVDLELPYDVTVYAQDSATTATTADYTYYVAVAPKLSVTLSSLTPNVSGTFEKAKKLNLTLNVLDQTSLAGIDTDLSYTLPVGVSFNSFSVLEDLKNGSPVAFTSGNSVDYSTKTVQFIMNVTDGNIGATYDVVYTVKLNLIK